MVASPNEPRWRMRLSTTDRERILGDLLHMDCTWLSERQRKHLQWGHGMRCRLDPADFKAAAAKVATERRIRLVLALMVLCGVPPGAARLARWKDVDLESNGGVWNVPRLHLPHCERSGMAPQEPFKKLSPLKPKAIEVFRYAREVGDGWLLLARIADIGKYLQRNDGSIRQPRRPPLPRGKDLIFPDDPRRRRPAASAEAPPASPQPLPEHTLGRRLRTLLTRL